MFGLYSLWTQRRASGIHSATAHTVSSKSQWWGPDPEKGKTISILTEELRTCKAVCVCNGDGVGNDRQSLLLWTLEQGGKGPVLPTLSTPDLMRHWRDFDPETPGQAWECPLSGSQPPGTKLAHCVPLAEDLRTKKKKNTVVNFRSSMKGCCHSLAAGHYWVRRGGGIQ